jgi:uncharacterized membrane protein
MHPTQPTQSTHPTHAAQRLQPTHPRQSAQPAMATLSSIPAHANTPALSAVPAPPATPALPTVPALPATAALPTVPALPATATLPTVPALPATAAPPTGEPPPLRAPPPAEAEASLLAGEPATRRTLARPDNLGPAMTSIAVTGYQLSVWVHISAVVVGLGATFAESIMFPVAMSLHPRHLPYVHRLQIAINQWLASPALAVILATGIYQAADGDWDFGSFWISASILIVVALGALNGAYFIPTDRRLGAMVEREVAAAGEGEVALSEEYQRRARTEGILGAVAGVLVIVVIYLMVVKPGA